MVHAGWPGLEQGVLGAAVAALACRRPGSGHGLARVRACTRRATSSAPTSSPGWSTASVRRWRRRTDAGAPALDIPAAVRVSLERAGVEQVTDVDVCTAASPDHFSHRRDGVTGRQAVVVVRTR